jgi:3-hydroxyacyl-CoA dehydrogenase
MGVPKTGVFGLYDLIGIDLMSDVARSLVSILPDNDVFHEVSAEIPVMSRMIDEGYIGNKVKKGGFYQPADLGKGTRRKTLDFDSFTYRDFEAHKPQVAIDAELAGDFTLLLDQDDKYGEYAWQILASTLCYAAALVPEVNDSLVAVDDAMKLGYNWIQGPFEMIDSIGVDRFIARLENDNRDIPDFVRTAAGQSFYRVRDGKLEHLMADGRYRVLERGPGIRRFSEERRTRKPLQENAAASYFELEHEVGLVEFHSKANALGPESMQLLEMAVQHAAENLTGLVIHNDAQHFSCGANLGSILGFIVDDDMDGLDRFLDHYQQTLVSMRDAPIPVVAAPSGLSMGGGFEVLLHNDKVIFHANSVSGLVETLVGVVPGGGGVKEMLYRWHERTADIDKAAWNAFMNIGYGKTARSPLEAEPLAMFRSGVDEYIMNRDRLLDTAISAVSDMSPDYTAVGREPLAMPGRDVRSEMDEWLQQALDKGRLTPHDVTTGSQVAMIVTGGDIDAGTRLTENDLLKLERKAFVTLGQTEETRARIEFMLEHGRPLRN